jgi:hypothetical protein
MCGSKSASASGVKGERGAGDAEINVPACRWLRVHFMGVISHDPLPTAPLPFPYGYGGVGTLPARRSAFASRRTRFVCE